MAHDYTQEVVHTAIRNIGEAYGCKDMAELAGILAALAAMYASKQGARELKGSVDCMVDDAPQSLPFTLTIN